MISEGARNSCTSRLPIMSGHTRSGRDSPLTILTARRSCCFPQAIRPIFFSGPKGAWSRLRSSRPGCGDAEVFRELFQCIEHKAMFEAQSRYRHDGVVMIRSVIKGDLPVEPMPLRNGLSIEALENPTT